MRNLSLAHGDAREMRDASDGVEIDGHPKLSKHMGTWGEPLYIADIWLANSDAKSAYDWPQFVRDAVNRLALRPVIGGSRQCVVRSQSKISPSASLPRRA
jgi:hypothetical protein